MNEVVSHTIEGFPPEVWEQLGFYVYRLIDPRDGKTFYVGKGVGNRVFEHAKGVLTEDSDKALTTAPNEEDISSILPLKNEIIRAIKDANHSVGHIIHRHGMADAKTAYQVEAALIDAYTDLSNIQGGHGSHTFGPMHASDILFAYNLPEIPLDDTRLLIININKLIVGVGRTDERARREAKDEIYRLVRYCWRISKQRAEKADYVLAAVKGVVVGVFVAHEWKAATSENFQPEIPYANDLESHRFGFFGQEASSEIWEKYVGERGKKLPKEVRHSQNPVKYWKC